MKAKLSIYLQPNYLTSRTAIVREQKQFIKIAFAVHLSAAISAERYRSDSVALKSAVPVFVYLCIVLIVHKYRQSAAQSCLRKKLSLSEIPTDRTFGNRWSRYKEPSKNKAEAYRVYVEHLFLRSDAGDARIFSKDDEHAQRVYIKYGNGVETRYKYDEKRRWLDTIETKNVQTQDVFQKIKYSFDPVGNVLGYANDATTYETQQTYSYDSLYQLISVEGTSNQYKGKKSFGMTPVSVAKYKQTFSFDNIGNMTNKLSTTNIPGSQGNSYPKAELDYSLDYEYDPAYAHRLIKAGTRYYRYDANGNITAEKDGPFTDEEEFVFTYSYDPETDVYGTDYGFGLDAPKETEQANPQDLFAYRRNYTWNERNLLTKSSDRNFTVHYRYGDDGQRALKYTDEGRSETLYFNNFFTIHIPTQDQNNPQGLRVHKHIFVGNSRLVTAMTHTDNQGDNEEQKVKRYYYHSDQLGSAQFVTDWHGRQYEHIEYTPYGELWIEEVAAGLDKLPFRFTGKELDEETGLYYYGARYLDPKYSRWLSGDPALGEYIPQAPINDEAKKHNENLPGMGGVFNVVNLHVYHYAGNNPVKYTDPDGETFIDDAINFLKGWINYEVEKSQSTFTKNTSFVPDPKYEAFNDILRNIDNFSKAAFQDHKFIDESIGKSGTDDEFLKAMYVASGADLRITQGQFNLNAEMGVVNAEGVIDIYNNKKNNLNFGFSLSGGASSFTGETALGLKDSSLTASIGASMLEYKGAINLKIGDIKVRLKGSFFIGGLGAGASLGPMMEFKLAAGIGGGIGLEFRKIEE